MIKNNLGKITFRPSTFEEQFLIIYYVLYVLYIWPPQTSQKLEAVQDCTKAAKVGPSKATLLTQPCEPKVKATLVVDIVNNSEGHFTVCMILFKVSV